MQFLICQSETARTKEDYTFVLGHSFNQGFESCCVSD